MTRRAVLLGLLALAVGVGLGLLGRVSDHLPPLVRWSASLGGPWLVAAWLLGAVSGRRREAAACGAVALCVGVATYYAVFLVVERATSPLYAVAMTLAWGAAAIPIGAAFAAAGADRGRPFAVAVLAGALVAESLLLLPAWESPVAQALLRMELAAGVLLALGFAGRRAPQALALTVPVAAVLLVAELCVREALWAVGWAGA